MQLAMATFLKRRTPARSGILCAQVQVAAALAVALTTTSASWRLAAAEAPMLRICTPADAPAATLDVAVALGSPAPALAAPATLPVSVSAVSLVAFAEEEVLAPALPAPAENPNDPDAEEINSQEEIAQERVFRPIGEVTANAALPPGLLPDSVVDKSLVPQHPLIGDPRFYGGWAEKDFRWSATKFAHHPLYFEEVNLERYGYQCSPCLQPFVSGAHFFATVPALPYLMTVHPPRECVYSLGYYRPGSCAPWQRNFPPCSCRGAAVEAAVVVGLVFLIP
jgi:hypothetical protein